MLRQLQFDVCIEGTAGVLNKFFGCASFRWRHRDAGAVSGVRATVAEDLAVEEQFVHEEEGIPSVWARVRLVRLLPLQRSSSGMCG